MAIPSTTFHNAVGIALMRYDGSNWTFVKWVLPGLDVIYDYPGAGTWTYQTWLVVGTGVSGASAVAVGIECSLIVQNLKR